jgi:uncharacterized protein YukE
MRLFSFPALAICAAGLLFSQVASAQSKVGVINFQKALLDTKELTKAAADLAAKFKPRQDALEKLQRELNDLQTQLQGSAGKSVELHLRSGEKMGGKIAQVTDNIVHLSNLTGAEYFDAFVDVKDISAVVVRAAGK